MTSFNSKGFVNVWVLFKIGFSKVGDFSIGSKYIYIYI